MYTWFLLEESTTHWPTSSLVKRKQEQVFIPLEDKLNYPHMVHARKYAIEMKDTRVKGWPVILNALEACSFPASSVWRSSNQCKYTLRYFASESSNTSPSALFEVCPHVTFLYRLIAFTLRR